ncbi:MAG: hypothetical protein AAFO07_06095, partial [Bacteroidota bacterium]
TTWLEELIGVAQAGPNELQFVREIALEALDRFDELILPYSTVVCINKDNLPSRTELMTWSAEDFVHSLTHYQRYNGHFNPDLRQLLHTSYKLAAESRDIFIPALKKHAELIGDNITDNILNRHIKPIFL